MKLNKYVVIITAFVISLSCTSENKSIYSGQVAYFPFSGNAKNAKNAFKDVTVGSAFLTSDRFGKDNSAYGFDGLSSYILMDVTRMPDIEKPKSIAWWYYSESMPEYNIDPDLGAENMIVLADSTASIGIQFGFRAPGYKTQGFDCWEWGGGTFFDITYPEFQKWHFCVYTFDGTIHKFYLDGELVATSKVVPKPGNPTQLMFGNYPGGDQFFKGKLDEIRIYNRILNEEEVEYLFNSL